MTEARRHTTTDWPWAPIPEAVLYSKDLDPLAVRVYGCLLRHGLDPSSCYPSHQRIGDLIGVSKRSVNRPLRDLEASGWIVRVPRYDERGDRTSDGFHVRTELGAPPAPSNVDPPTPSSADPPRQGARENESQGNQSQGNENVPAGADDDSKGIEPSEDVVRLATLLADLIEENGSKRPSMTKSGFLDPIRLLIDKDGRTVEQVERAIRWSQKDEFWRSVILSGRNLRTKYDQMRLQASRQRPGSVAQVRDAAQEYLDRKGRS